MIAGLVKSFFDDFRRKWHATKFVGHTHTCRCGKTWTCGDEDCDRTHCDDCERAWAEEIALAEMRMLESILRACTRRPELH